MKQAAWIWLFTSIGVILIGAWWIAGNLHPPVYQYDAVKGYIQAPGAKALSCNAYTTGAGNHYTTCQTPGGTNYQVPTGKAFTVTRVLFQAGTAASAVTLGYGDTAVTDSASGPTNPVTLVGTTGTPPISPLIEDTANLMKDVEIVAVVPAGKYPFIQGQAAATEIQIMGIEQ